MGEGKGMCLADSVLNVGQMRDTPEATETCDGQVEGFRLYSSCQDAVGIDGEAIEFKWKFLSGFSSLSVLEKIQQDFETWRMQPEEVEDRIICI